MLNRGTSFTAALFAIVMLALSPTLVLADTLATNLAVPFDWQRTWGTIHINSYADNLNDPNIPSTSDGVVSCPAGANQCGASGVAGGSVIHGIKHDIKNSVVNCMSSQLPTCAVSNGGCPNPAPPWNRGIFSNIICSMSQGAHGNVDGKPIGDPYSLVYMPMFDPRSNDDSFLGWQQLITNNCIRDIHADEVGHGAFSPISHVFSNDEKDNWVLAKNKKGLAAGAQLPDKYYYYQLKSDNSFVFATIEPDAKDIVAGSLKTVDNYSNDLAKIQAYTLKNTADSDSFVIVDPSQFYDLRKYAYTGSPEPYANCPVLGLKMYDGICDPTGHAGCNLPIYGVGPTTTFNGENGKTFTTNNYPIVWSGYVLKWGYISTDEYWASVKNRVNVDKMQLYMQPFNSNPILAIQRDSAYCTNEEMTSNPASGVADLPCVQYLQYVTDGSHALAGKFIDMYNPTSDAGTTNNAAAYVLKHDYNVNNNGTLGNPVLGASGDPVTFFDTGATYTSGAHTGLAVEPSQTVTTKDGKLQPGQKQGDGAGIPFSLGTSIAVQLNNQTVRWNGKDVNCLEFSYSPGGKETKDAFIPTNSVSEYQSFVDAVSNGMLSPDGLAGMRISGKTCSTHYKAYNTASQPANPNGTQTWFGTTSCAQIASPSCNQVTSISAQRYCQRSTGFLGACGECDDVTDPDAKLDAGPGGMISTYNVPNSQGKTNTCYFKAYCHSLDTCPGLKTGGHVFCLAADTKITMADGSEKAIQLVKAGDEVMAFDAKQSKGMLRKAKVRASTITENQKLMQIDDLKITPLHKVVLANGRAVVAKDIKVGDKILKASGLFITVKKVEKNLPAVTVYNLSLDDADGYIADGLRVLQYPIPAELVK
ncbi:MAG: hypothetical protein K2Q32_01225 [Alphaproteobacteria bacterium]|nr:hypothetical protein [Alphaproteobacteria bacterium]